MRAFGYLIAGVALLTTTAAQLLPAQKLPAANAALSNGWRYKGCFSDVNAALLNTDRALGGYLQILNTNGGAACTSVCRSQGFKYAGTDDNACWCDNVINRNNSITAGIAAPLGDLNCQTGCRGNLNEACGQTNLFISIYEFTGAGSDRALGGGENWWGPG
ncbi:hypothetical protein C7974DRAFT_380614 [Boeremia exigua]|uniref:uncharacterized protein n=1 Tax=Boeremia exigua TaxID=749465 RepID=UPI001E8E304B|nr:uncharacterized protein C7974DRAFT_380614 [Boeremia exigua]KAH6614272.1 hypothetical protein C7974DRAFT_380614 [Boeremia exigua]